MFQILKAPFFLPYLADAIVDSYMEISVDSEFRYPVCFHFWGIVVR